MSRPLILSAAFGLMLATAAQAQPVNPVTTPSGNPSALQPTPPPDRASPAPSATAPTAPAPSATAPPAVDTSATTSPYKVGMEIRDAQGSLIGKIARVIKTPDGATTISASVDGRNVNLPASALTISGTGAVSSMSKAQITASTAPPV